MTTNTIKRILSAAPAVILVLVLAGVVPAGERPPDGRRGRPGGKLTLTPEAAALQPLSVMLGRPTDKSITANVLSAEEREGFIEYGVAAGQYTAKTAVTKFPAGAPVEVLLDGLKADTRYFYRLQHRKPGEEAFTAGAERGFSTQRAAGSAFTFEIQGDSHPERAEKMYDPALYTKTLLAAAADKPDFYMTIGDDFSVDTLREINLAAVKAVYLHQRCFLGLVGQTAPVFLVNGNHEQAAKCNLDGTADNVAVLAQNCRNRYFPQPAPDGFYTGDEVKVEHIGLLRDYYAWTWGDALFAVIDPYWHSDSPVDNAFGPKAGDRAKGARDLWQITLGDEQYQWLKKTLETSKAKHKFVFTHHVNGTGRGGIELAGQFEWGGKSRRGEDEFKQKRPGWELPIHQLMAKNGVAIFFQGHDHVFVRQQLDGVVYQELPTPADFRATLEGENDDFRGAYRSGNIVGGAGRVRVNVSPERVKVEFLRSRLAKDATAEHPDGEVAFSYEVPAKKPAGPEAGEAGVEKKPESKWGRILPVISGSGRAIGLCSDRGHWGDAGRLRRKVMSTLHRILAPVAVAVFCLGSSLLAAEGAGPRDGDGARMGPPDGARGQGNREGGDQRMRPPQAPPFLGEVKGMKEELQKHQEVMKALQDQIREVMGKPEDRKDKGDPKDGPKDGAKDAPREIPPALKAKVEEIAPKIVDEFIRHQQAVLDLLKASREEAIQKLTEHMQKPPMPGRRGDGPNAQRGERGERGERDQPAPVPGEHGEF
jgi:hypothetical protein